MSRFVYVVRNSVTSAPLQYHSSRRSAQSYIDYLRRKSNPPFGFIISKIPLVSVIYP